MVFSVKKMTNAGRLKHGNKHTGFVFFKKRGFGYKTFKTIKDALKHGYNPKKIAKKFRRR